MRIAKGLSDHILRGVWVNVYQSLAGRRAFVTAR